MKKFILITILLLTTTLIFTSCNKHGGPKEGELIYEITYLESERENPLIALLPKTVVMRFKDDKTIIYVVGFFGTFKLRFITDNKEKKSYTIFNFMDKKYISQDDIQNLSAGYKNFPDLKIIQEEKKEDTIFIGGLLSYQAEVFCSQMSDSTMSLYYSYDLNINNPNSNNPYSEIEGVLTKFQTNVAGIDMIFELVDFNNIKISEKDFQIPDDYEELSTEELNKILQDFQQ